MNCPYCESEKIDKNGFNKYKDKKVQKYKCLDCKKLFSYENRIIRTRLDADIINLSFDLYVEGLSYRVIRRIIYNRYSLWISHVDVYNWLQNYTPIMKKYLEKFKPQVSAVWQMDETMIDFKGKKYWCWICEDTVTRYVIEMHLSLDKSIVSGEEFFKKIQKTGLVPKIIATDGNPCYPSLIKKYFPKCTQMPIDTIKVKPNNSFIERFNGTVKHRTKTMRGFDEFCPCQKTLYTFQIFYNLMRPHMSLEDKTPASAAKITLHLKDRWITLIRWAQKDHQL